MTVSKSCLFNSVHFLQCVRWFLGLGPGIQLYPYAFPRSLPFFPPPKQALLLSITSGLFAPPISPAVCPFLWSNQETVPSHWCILWIPFSVTEDSTWRSCLPRLLGDRSLLASNLGHPVLRNPRSIPSQNRSYLLAIRSVLPRSRPPRYKVPSDICCNAPQLFIGSTSGCILMDSPWSWPYTQYF